ncbi:hypothetical protein GPB2148_2136 [marine gamma proteobacterium HTCC2148]|nr:hypothetical protein GPB2148_2136 [marine gamma proteobacterium HTCC2148]
MYQIPAVNSEPKFINPGSYSATSGLPLTAIMKSMRFSEF